MDAAAWIGVVVLCVGLAIWVRWLSGRQRVTEMRRQKIVAELLHLQAEQEAGRLTDRELKEKVNEILGRYRRPRQ